MASREKIRRGFGEKLRLARERKRLEPEALAEMMGVNRTAIHHWENGRNLPEPTNLFLIHEILGVSLAYLFETEEDELEGVVEVYANQGEANDPIKDFIAQNRPSELYLIQYSSLNVKEVIQTFSRFAPPKSSPKVYLLVKYIGTKEIEEEEALNYKERGIHVVDPYQYKKAYLQLETLIDVDKNLPGVTVDICCYHAPAAMRAAYIGCPFGEKLRAIDPDRPMLAKQDVGLVSLSYYRYTGRVGGVNGQDNPLLHARTNTRKGKMFYSLFEETFVDLWNDSKLAEPVLREIQANLKSGK